MQKAETSPAKEQPDDGVRPTTTQSHEAQSSKVPDELSRATRTKKTRIATPPPHLFIVGFYSALIIAILCLGIGAFYLYRFMESANSGIERLLDSATSQRLRLAPPSDRTNSNSSSGETEAQDNLKPAEPRVMPPGYLEVLINGRLVMARLALLSCGVSVGFAFGFLGFALFLLGIKGSIDTDLQTEQYKVSFTRLAPGLLLLLASIILIGVCVTRQTPFEYGMMETGGVNSSSPSLPERTLENGNKGGEAPKEQLPPRVQ